MYNIIFTKRIKRDMKLMKKRGKDMNKLITILDTLARGIELPEKNQDHALQGYWADFRECHIEPDWLLIYKIIDEDLVIAASRTGSHSDLF